MEFVGPLPIELFRIVELVIIIFVLFIYFRRPMYECMLAALLFAVSVTGRYDLAVPALVEPMTSPILFTIVAFLVASHLLARTHAIEGIVETLLSVIGRFRGGSGYSSLLASAFMASLSGTGPGNVAATGVFTIPTMIKTGFPRALAATTEMAASALGNIIPPSGIVLLSFGVYQAMVDDPLPLSRIWLIAWSIGLYFLAQRIIVLWLLLRRSNIDRLDSLPPFGPAVRSNFLYLLVPVIILLPLIVDLVAAGYVGRQLGTDGAKLFSDLALLCTPALAGAYAVFLGWRRGVVKSGRAVFNMVRSSAVTVAPVAVTIYLAYAVAVLFRELGMDAIAVDWLLNLGLSRPMAIVLIPLVLMVLGMVLPGSSQIALFGGAVMTLFAALGVNPLLVAALLPALTGAMEGMTPPLALGMYIAMGIARSGFTETSLYALFWIIAHAAVAIVLLSGILPVAGLGG